MSKSYYRVFFSSNSQQKSTFECQQDNVKELLSCFLFKQFTTPGDSFQIDPKCQRATIVFSFQAIHNDIDSPIWKTNNVKELLSCFLFKQFTT